MLRDVTLDKKSNKKIKAPNKKAENLNLILKSTNSPENFNDFIVTAGSESVGFLTDQVEIFQHFLFNAATVVLCLSCYLILLGIIAFANSSNELYTASTSGLSALISGLVVGKKIV